MDKEKQGLFKTCMQIPQGKKSFIITVLATLGCWAITFFVDDTSRSTTLSMICGVISVISCQQFVRVMSAVIISRNNPPDDDE